MLDHLADASIRSFVLAVPAAIVLWILPGKRTAALQHAVWAAVVYGMLALFAFGQHLPRLPLRILERPAVAAQVTPSATIVGDLLEAPTGRGQPSASDPTQARSPIGWKDVVVYAYGTIAFVFLVHFLTGMFLVRKLIATAHPVPRTDGHSENEQVYESEAIAVPLTVGWVRPWILLPSEWREWSPEKLNAIIAHEGAHVRRHDGLVAALAGLNRCLFWFHPLGWMLERKLALLAEQACDESCVAALGDRQRYAHLLLEMARVVDESQGRLRRHVLRSGALTMAGSHLRQRIDALLEEGRTFSRGLSWTGWAAVLVCGIPVVLGAGGVELARRPPLISLAISGRNVTAGSVSKKVPEQLLPEQKLPEVNRTLLAQARTTPAQASAPQPSIAATPKFDTASVRRCLVGDGNGRGGRGGGGGRGIPISPPGNLYINCLSVSEMVDLAYGQYAGDPLVNDSPTPMDTKRIRGGPAWIYSDFYTIDAQTNDPVANGPTSGPTPANSLLRGPMLRALLEDQFRLRTHRETENVPMYALTVAKGGLKMQPMEEGGCRPHDPMKGLLVSEMFPPGQTPLCVSHLGWDGPNWSLDAAGQSLDRLAGSLSLAMDRHVLDKTGIAALFNFNLVFAHDDATPGNFPSGFPSPFTPSDSPAGPSIFAVLEQRLGLTLLADTGPRGFIVIDSVEQPSEN